MEFIKASKLTFNPRAQMAAIFADGFYDHGLKFFSKDKAKLARATEHIFLLDSFYVAVEDEEVMAFVGVAPDRPPPVKLDAKILRQHLGLFRGSLAAWGLGRFMVGVTYPCEVGKDTGCIEFVATAAAHRGKGLAKILLTHVMETEPYKDYILEVIDTNKPAIAAYEKLGFKEFAKEPSPGSPKQTGFEFKLYMRRKG